MLPSLKTVTKGANKSLLAPSQIKWQFTSCAFTQRALNCKQPKTRFYSSFLLWFLNNHMRHLAFASTPLTCLPRKYLNLFPTKPSKNWTGFDKLQKCKIWKTFPTPPYHNTALSIAYLNWELNSRINVKSHNVKSSLQEKQAFVKMPDMLETTGVMVALSLWLLKEIFV